MKIKPSSNMRENLYFSANKTPWSEKKEDYLM